MKLKHFFAAMLTLLLLVCCGVAVNAAIVVSTGTCGDNLSYQFDHDTGLLTIRGTGPMYDYNPYGHTSNAPWADYLKEIKNIVIEDGVTSIGKNAFYCVNLRDVIIADTVTSIGSAAFSNCSNIEKITIPDSVTTIEEQAFSGCRRATYINLPKTMTKLGDAAFNGCWSLLSVTIPNGITQIGTSMFEGCESLSDVTLPKSITKISDYAFNACYALENVYYYGTLEQKALIEFGESNSYLQNVNWYYENTYTFETNGGAEINSITDFYIRTEPETTRYPEFTFGGWYESSDFSGERVSFPYIAEQDTTLYAKWLCTVTYIKGNETTTETVEQGGKAAYAYPANDTEVFTYTVNGEYWEGENITSNVTVNVTSEPLQASGDGWAFSTEGTFVVWKNEALISTDAHSSWVNFITTADIKKIITYPGIIDVSGFHNCSNLKDVYFANTVTYIYDDSFTDCTALENINIPDSVTYIGQNAFCNCTSLTDITLGNSIKYIYGSAFNNCSALKNINIPDSVTTIGGQAFFNCTSLTDITLGNSIQYIDDRAFYNCTELKNVYIKDLSAWCGINFITETSNPLSNFGNLYLNGELVQNLVIPENVITIKRYAFNYCKSINEVVIPDNVQIIGIGAFRGVDITKLTIGKGITQIGTDAFLDNSYPFLDVYISDLSAWCGIFFENYAANPLHSGFLFLNGNYITDLTIPDGVTSISKYAFYNCDDIEKITIPEGVTTIDEYAFCSCDNLKNITLPKSLLSVYGLAFYECSALKDVYYNSTIDKKSNITVVNINNTNSNLTNADWHYKCTYTLKPNGGVMLSDSVITAFSLDSEPSIVCKGFKFDGWYTTPDFSGEKITFPYSAERDTTLYAKYLVLVRFTYEYTAYDIYIEPGSNFVLPTCPDYGYHYTFTVNGTPWSGENITENTNVYVEKAVNTYTITYTGGFCDGTVDVPYFSDVTLPSAPDGYVYRFYVDGALWDGTGVEKDITVLVERLYDTAELNILNLENVFVNDKEIRGNYYGQKFKPQINITNNASYKLYANSACTSEVSSYTLLSGLNTFYINVTLESGRTELYTFIINRDIPQSLGKLTLTQGAGANCTFKVEAEIKGNPIIKLLYGTNLYDISYERIVEFNSEKQTIYAENLPEKTELYFKVVALYDEIKVESDVLQGITGENLSPECDVIKMLSPLGGTIEGETISALRVTNKFEKITIAAEVSKGARWELHEAKLADSEIKDKTIELKEGDNRTYIKVFSEDGKNSKTYTVKIYRQTKSVKPIIKALNGKATITAPNNENGTIIYTIDGTIPSENNGIIYEAPFAVSENQEIIAVFKQAGKDEISDATEYIVPFSIKVDIDVDKAEISDNKCVFDFYINTSKAIDSGFIVTVYDINEKLIGIKAINADFSNYYLELLSYEVNVCGTPHSYKIMLWDGFINARPLIEPLGNIF